MKIKQAFSTRSGRMQQLVGAVLTPALMFSLSLAVAPATAQIRIGELNSYKSQPAFLEPY
jgi:branched-subunit amino acid permease